MFILRKTFGAIDLPTDLLYYMLRRYRFLTHQQNLHHAENMLKIAAINNSSIYSAIHLASEQNPGSGDSKLILPSANFTYKPLLLSAFIHLSLHFNNQSYHLRQQMYIYVHIAYSSFHHLCLVSRYYVYISSLMKVCCITNGQLTQQQRYF